MNTQRDLIWYFPGMVKRKVFVVLPKHPFTALYISVRSLPSRVRPPTHTVLKHSLETVIKPFPQVTQIRLVKAVNWRKDPAGSHPTSASHSTLTLIDNICSLHLKAQMHHFVICFWLSYLYCRVLIVYTAHVLISNLSENDSVVFIFVSRVLLRFFFFVCFGYHNKSCYNIVSMLII